MKGIEIGEVYQQNCIASWRSAGFEPISANSIYEGCSHSIRKILIRRDASALTGRPHLFLTDLLNLASAEARGQPFVLMNADLVIPPASALAAKVGRLRAGEFILSRRIDIDELGQTDGVRYYSGYDFFAGHGDDILSLAESNMVFGAPWWDHYLPLVMYMHGCRMYQIKPAVLHLSHTKRWNWAVWEKLGRRFITEIDMYIGENGYKTRLNEAIKRRTGRVLSDLQYSIWKRLPKNAANERRRMLHRVSDANLMFLDETSLVERS